MTDKEMRFWILQLVLENWEFQNKAFATAGDVAIKAQILWEWVRDSETR